MSEKISLDSSEMFYVNYQIEWACQILEMKSIKKMVPLFW